MAEYIKAPIMTLETPRLLLRPLALSDAPKIQELIDNWNVLKYLFHIPYPYPTDGAEQFLNSVLEIENRYYWAIVLKSNSELIGQLSLRPEDEQSHRGFWLGEPYWSQGYMKEAAAASQDFAFDILKMKELLLENAMPNTASHRLKERAGARLVSVELREYLIGTLPGACWRLTAEAWAANREHFMHEKSC